MSQALYRKWRPARFEQVIGQEHVTQTLRNSVVAERVGHAYLFCGPRGTGKTTSARLLAKAVNCLHPDLSQRPCDDCRICHAVNDGRFLDLIEIDAASNTGVDDIRDLRDKINFAPNEGKFKVYIIDEVHMLSTAAFNALLKTLEEPPAHAKFVLATTEEHKVPMTIKSRCQQFNFRLLTTQEIIDRLQWIIDQEGLAVEEGVLDLVAQHGAGSLRDAESLLDQLVGAPSETITLAKTQAVLGTAAGQSVAQLVDAVLAADGAAGLEIIHEALNTGADTRQFCRQVVSYVRDVLLLKTSHNDVRLDVPTEQQEAMWQRAQRAPRTLLIDTIRNFNEAAVGASTNWQPQLPLELAFITSLPEEETIPVAHTTAVPARTAAQQPAPSKATTQTPPADPSPPPTSPTKTNTPPTQPTSAAPTDPTPPKSAPEPASKPAVSQYSLSDIKGKKWREFLARAGDANRNIKNWLNMSQPLAFEGSTLVLGFEMAFLPDKVAAEQQEVDAALSAVMESEMHVRCVMTNEYRAPTTEAKRTFRQEAEELAEELGGVIHAPQDGQSL